MAYSLPSLSNAFSALGNAFKAPQINTGSTPGIANPFSIAPYSGVTPSNVTQPAVPRLTPQTTVAKPSPYQVPSNLNSSSVPNIYSTNISPGYSNSTPALPSVSTPAQSTYKVPSNVGTQTTPNIYSTSTAIGNPNSTTPVFSPYVTSQSGVTVNPNTGGVVSHSSTPSTPAQPSLTNQDQGGVTAYNAPDFSAPVDTGNTGNASSISNYSGSAGGAPGTPTLPDGSSNYNPLITNPDLEAAYKKYQDSLQMSPEEVAAQKRLNDLNTASAKAYTNTQNQAIALPFITGQQAALQREQSTLATPLTAELTLAQQQRQLASQGAEAGLNFESSKLSAARDLVKPVATTYGGTLSRYNPQTGNYETVVNPFGSASGTASGTDLGSGSTQDVLGQLTAAGITPTRYSIPGYVAAVQAGVPIQTIINNQAAKTFLNSTDTQKFIANSNTALNTINDPTQGIKALSNAVNRTNVTVLNNGLLKVKEGISDPATAQFVQQANILADEVSKLLGSGQGSDFAIQLGQALVNPSYSQEAFNATMDNLAGRVQNKVSEYVKQGTATGTNFGTSGSSSGSSVYDF